MLGFKQTLYETQGTPTEAFSPYNFVIMNLGPPSLLVGFASRKWTQKQSWTQHKKKGFLLWKLHCSWNKWFPHDWWCDLSNCT